MYTGSQYLSLDLQAVYVMKENLFQQILCLIPILVNCNLHSRETVSDQKVATVHGQQSYRLTY